MGKAREVGETQVGRRELLKGALAMGAVAAVPMKAEGSIPFEKFFQKHYKELSPEVKERVLRRIEEESRKEYGREVKVGDPAPMEGVKFAFALNLSKCNGNRRCVEACAKENNLDPSIRYIKVLEMQAGTMNLEKGNSHYEGMVPKEGKYYLPVQCNQCENPPCVKACPVEATWKEKDGIVVVDYDWCIGCRYCQSACPYEARHFNWRKPELTAADINPNQAYLSNRPRPKGVIEKCTYCLHRTRKGLNPACLEACPTGARKFGNMLDPEGEIAQILKTKRVFVLKEELNTVPRFFYYFD